MKELIPIINRHYNIQIFDIVLMRKTTGTLYKLQGKDTDYMMKCYSSKRFNLIADSLDVIQYLFEKKINSLRVIPTRNEKKMIHLEIEGVDQIGVIYSYAHGIDPNPDYDFDRIIEHMKKIHNAMKKYPNKLNYFGKSYYIDKGLEIFILKNISTVKLIEMTVIAKDLYQFIEELPRTFCHGDFSINNLIKDIDGELTVLDFDASNKNSYLLDVAVLADQTDFKILTKKQFNQTIKMIDYIEERYHKFSLQEKTAILAYIAVRHFELVGNIGSERELKDVPWDVLDEQYTWLTQYYSYFETWLSIHR